MNKRDRVATYYNNARILVKNNNPKAARAYVLGLLNEALDAYHCASTILSKARTAAFMDRWIAVSRDLYNNGITDYVLECFGLKQPMQQPVAKPSGKQSQGKVKKDVPPKEEQLPTPSEQHDIDMSGLIDAASKTQGWCAEVFEMNKSAVVEITVSSSTNDASGTGFIISQNGYLLTNDHVVFDEVSGQYYPKASMSFIGSKKDYKIEVLFSDKKADIALCKFNADVAQDFTAVKRIVDYSGLKQGADCLVIGNAFGMGLAPFTGIIRFTKNREGDMVYTAPSNPGDSGGPVFNRIGECIGINKSRTVAVNGTAAEAYANATPMDKIDELLKKWTDANYIEL